MTGTLIMAAGAASAYHHEEDHCYILPPVHHKKNSDKDEVDIPNTYLCPLTLEIMSDPLMNRYGQNYERSAILEWLNRGNTVCPMTKQPLTASGLIPNARLRSQIVSWRMNNGYYDKEEQIDYYDNLKKRQEGELPGTAGDFKGILVVPKGYQLQQRVKTSEQQRRRKGMFSRLTRSLRS